MTPAGMTYNGAPRWWKEVQLPGERAWIFFEANPVMILTGPLPLEEELSMEGSVT